MRVVYSSSSAVHFPFLSLDRSFLGFFLEEEDAFSPFSSADTEAAAEGFGEPASSSPEAEDEDDVEDALEEGAASVLLAPRLGLSELFGFALEAVGVSLELVIGC